MILLDEIRLALTRCIKLSNIRVSTDLLGGLSSIVVYGTLIEASEKQIETALGLYCSQFIPYNTVFQGDYNSINVGSAFATQAALQCLEMSIMGLKGPEDIFNQKDSIFKILLGNQQEDVGFEMILSWQGQNFGALKTYMRFGCYNIFAASIIHNLFCLILQENLVDFMNYNKIRKVTLIPCTRIFNEICQETKLKPANREQAMNSAYFITGLILKKCFEMQDFRIKIHTLNDMWKHLVPQPEDFSKEMIEDKVIHQFIQKIEVLKGDEKMDNHFPKYIPTYVTIQSSDGQEHTSLVDSPEGHWISQSNIEELLNHKTEKFGKSSLQESEFENLKQSLSNFENLSNQQLRDLYKVRIQYQKKSLD